MFIIYKAIHLSSDKFYVGFTSKSLPERIGLHWAMPEHKRYAFQHFLHSTKMEDWKWEIIQTVETYKEARDCEMYYIRTLDAYKNGLNESTGCTDLKKRTEYSNRMKAYRAANPEPWHKGRRGVYSEDTLARMSLAKLKNPVRALWTEERKLEASKKYGKRVKELKSGLIFDSISKAAAHFKLRRECVRDVVNGKRKQTAGLVFVETA